TSKFEGFAYNLSNHDDIAELYLVSDILITDYSSVFFDYAHLQRPILFYTYDLEMYRVMSRGLCSVIHNVMPGTRLSTSEDVIESIQNINNVQSNYKNRYNEFYNRFCSWDNGHASEKTVKTVFFRENKTN